MVVENLEEQLAEWEKRQPGVSRSAAAGAALRLAAHLDNERTNPTAAATVASALDRMLERIEAGLPVLIDQDEVDELKAQRAKRLAG